MAKLKRKGLSEKVRGDKKKTDKKVNPFEVKINRQKHDVLGKKMSKHDKGMPGVSRSKAIQMRKETLLTEYQKRSKSNKFVDKRIGENDPSLSLEDKMMKRFASERQKHHDKSNVFNLNEEEELTHYGQSLSEIEKFEDPQISDAEEEEDQEQGRIDASIVRDEHFGGFLTKRTEEEGKSKSWKERMEEVIARSKLQKHERQTEKEKTIEMTQQADAEWKELQLMMAAVKKTNKAADESEQKKKIDDYDIMVRELKFEIKGKPTDRLKTEEELAKEEKERLEKLEEDRVKRMFGFTEKSQPKKMHQSPDDLDDMFALDKPDKFHLSYKDGKMLTEDGSSEEEDDDENQEEDEDNVENENEQDEDDENEDEDDENEDNSDEESEDDAMERTSDLESEEDEEEETKDEVKTKKSVKFLDDDKQQKLNDEVKEKAKKEMMAEARKEVPYTFRAPENYSDLLNLLEKYSEDKQPIVVERLRKCHHPSLAEGNKEKLQNLCKLLIHYYGVLCLNDPPKLKLMESLVKHLYELSQQSPIESGQVLLDVVKEKQEELHQICQRKGGRGVYPTLDVMMQLKLISILFPTSDFKHPVTTPTMLYMSQLLTLCPVNAVCDIVSGLFVCTLFLEYVSVSKRFVPEVINFLHGLLFLASKKEENKIEKVIPPFKPVGNINLLELESPKKAKKLDLPQTMNIQKLFSSRQSEYLETDECRLICINQSLKLLQKYASLYESLPCFSAIFEPIMLICSKLPVENYPQIVQKVQSELVEAIKSQKGKVKKHLTMDKKKPKIFKQFEPKFEETFDGKKKRGGNKDFNEKQRLLHKHKKETKGAIREIRKDAQFLATQKLNDQMEKDAERKRKVREIYGMLSAQEGEVKALKRKKAK